MKTRWILLFILCFTFSLSYSQRPSAKVYKIPEGMSVIVNNSIDEVWQYVEPNHISKPLKWSDPEFNTNPTWKALWDENALYVLVEVSDNEWAPSWITNTEDWKSDRIELYFDVNSTIYDGNFQQMGTDGHYQIAPNYCESPDNNSSINAGFGADWDKPYSFGCWYDTNGDSFMEYRIPFSSLTDDSGLPLNPIERSTFGYDVYVLDNVPSDPYENAHVIGWANDAKTDYDGEGGTYFYWEKNMDNAGEITLVNETLSLLNSEKDIVSFSINGISAEIFENDIYINVSTDTDLTGMVAEFELSEETVAKVNGVVQESGVTVNDFSEEVIYTVVAEDNTEKKYSIHVYATGWTEGFPNVTSALTSARLNINYEIPGIAYYLISDRYLNELLAQEIYDLALSNSSEEYIAVGQINVPKGNTDFSVIIEDRFSENSSYYSYTIFESENSEIDALPVIIKHFQTKEYKQVYPAGTTSTPHGLLRFAPDNYYLYPDSLLPVVIYLHGSGGSGDGSQSDLLDPTKVYIPDGVQNIPYEHILIYPQCLGGWWKKDNLEKTVDYVIKELNIDTTRIYMAGMSMGGGGITISLNNFHEKIAAVVPTAPAGILKSPLKDVPIWTLHNKYDEVAQVEHSYFIADSVLVADGNIVMTVFPRQGHDAWNPAYNNRKVWDWLFAQKKDGKYKPGGVITGREIPGQVTLDGVLEEEEWKMPYEIMTEDGTKAKFDLLWSEEEKIYVAVKVIDSDKQDNQDKINLYIDGDFNQGNFNSVDRVFSFALNNSAVTEVNGNLTGVKNAWSETENGYILEAEIPINNYADFEMTKGYTKGHTIGFDIEIIDSGSANDNCFWQGDDNNYSSTDSYGVVSLINQPSRRNAEESAFALYTENAPEIDGEKDEVWNESNRLKNEWIFIKGVPDSDFDAEANLLWNEQNLYLFAKIHDPIKVNSADNGNPELNDHLKVLIDMDLIPGTFDDDTKYLDVNDYHFTFLRDSELMELVDFPDRSTNELMSNTEFSTIETTEGWVIEARFPFESLCSDFVPQVNARIGFDMVIGDNDEPADDKLKFQARLGNRLERNSDFVYPFGGSYWADPVSWIELELLKSDDLVSISKLENNKSDLFVFPNPTTGKVFLGVNDSKLRKVSVLTIDGVHVTNFNTTKKAIDLAGYPKGIYILRLENDSEVNVFKVILK